MTVEKLGLSELLLISPDIYPDERGFFMETYQKEKFREAGIDVNFVQDNHSQSKKGVIRGMKFQWDKPTSKLVRVTKGKVYAVAVDIRADSPTLGKWEAVELSEENKKFFYVPFGFAFGFCALSEEVDVLYKITALHNGDGAATIRWNDPDLAIDWPIKDPIISSADQTAPNLKEWLSGENAKHILIKTSQ